MGALAAVVAALLLAAGCGSGGEGGSPPPLYDLTITFWPQGRDGEMRRATLTCEPDGGSHPDPAKACAALLAHVDALDSPPPNTACTELYGGDQVATVTGPGLRASFSRANGCEIMRWDVLAPLLELPG